VATGFRLIQRAMVVRNRSARDGLTCGVGGEAEVVVDKEAGGGGDWWDGIEDNKDVGGCFGA
jgi:hypothetical protein